MTTDVPAPPRWLPWAAIALVLAAYANSLPNAFQFDDGHVIVDNAYMRDPANIPRFFTDARMFSSLPSNAAFRPLLSATLAFDYWLARGPRPVVFHVHSLLWLVLLWALAQAFFRRVLVTAVNEPLAGWLALFAATLFAIHTGNTQVGNYLSARSELISACGVLASFLAYLRWPGLRESGLYLLPMLLGALAKTPAVMFVPLLACYRLFIEEQVSVFDLIGPGAGQAWRKALRAASGIVLPLVIALGAFKAIEGMNPPNQTYGGGDRVHYLWTQAWVLVRYVRVFFWPSGLTADTDLELFTTWKDPRFFAGLAVLGLLLAAAAWWSRSARGRIATFGVLWFLLSILPTAVVPLAEVENDHRAFMGYLGAAVALAAGLAWLIETWPARAKQIGWALVAVVLLHGVATHVRNRVWRSEESLWADVVQKSPRNGRGLMNYGRTLMAKGQLAEALAIFQRAKALLPYYGVLEINLGVVKAALGRDGEVEAHYRQGIGFDPNGVVGRRIYAEWLITHSRAAEAVVQLEMAKSLSPAEASVANLLDAVLAARDGGAPDRLAALAERRALTPKEPSGHGWHLLGFELAKQSRHVDAVLAYRLSLERGASAALWNDLGWSLGQLGFRAQAQSAFEEAVRLAPGTELYVNNLKWLSERAP